MLALGALALPVPAHGAALSVTPGVATAGAPVTVTARGLKPRAAGVARLPGARSRGLRVDAQGRASVVLTLRGSAHGSRRLTVRAGGTGVSTRLTVVARRRPPSTLGAVTGGPRVLLAPSRGRAGDRLTVRISGFGRRAVTVRLGAVTVARGRATRRALVLSPTVPALGSGPQRLVVRSARTTLALAFELLPSVAVVQPPPAPPPPPVPPPDAVFVGAGDIATCNSTGDEATAALLDSIAGTVFTLGDNAYPTGTLSQFNDCYDPTWGRHKARTRPAPGNHEYDTQRRRRLLRLLRRERRPGRPRATTATTSAPGTSSCSTATARSSAAAGRLGAGAVAARRPRRAPGELHARATGTTRASAPARARQRRRRCSRSGRRSTTPAPTSCSPATTTTTSASRRRRRPAPPIRGYGIREFVVGTGGASHSTFATVAANSEARNADTFGVLKLTLRAAGYDWQFVPEAGKTFTDTGTGACHGAPA